MKIESRTTPKYRDLSQPGDDILVVLPQCLYAVFDGATDTAGVSVQGESPGVWRRGRRRWLWCAMRPNLTMCRPLPRT